MWFMAESTIKVVGGARHSLYVIACYRVKRESSQFDIMSLTLTKKENIILLFIYIKIVMAKDYIVCWCFASDELRNKSTESRGRTRDSFH